MVLMTKDVNITHFEKIWKNTFLVNAKNGKSGKNGLKNKTNIKWHWQTVIISSIHDRMQKIGMIKRVVTEDETFFKEFAY